MRTPSQYFIQYFTCIFTSLFMSAYSENVKIKCLKWNIFQNSFQKVLYYFNHVLFFYRVLQVIYIWQCLYDTLWYYITSDSFMRLMWAPGGYLNLNQWNNFILLQRLSHRKKNNSKLEIIVNFVYPLLLNLKNRH